MTVSDSYTNKIINSSNLELDDLVIEKLEKYAAILEKKLVDKNVV